MATALIASFATRRDAEMTVERLVQEHGVERTTIVLAAAGDANSAGEATAGSDAATGEPALEARDDAALNGRVIVSVDVPDDARAAAIRAAFAEFDAVDVAAG